MTDVRADAARATGLGLLAGGLAILAGARLGPDLALAGAGAAGLLAAATARGIGAGAGRGATIGAAAGLLLAAPLADLGVGGAIVAAVGTVAAAAGAWTGGARGGAVALAAAGLALAAAGRIPAPEPADVASLAGRPGEPVRATATRLDARGRTDGFVVGAGPETWSFADGGAPVPVVAAVLSEADRRALAARFPLEALAVAVARPERLLTVAPGPGPETELARLGGADDVEIAATRGPGAAPRRALRRDAPVDLAVLRCPPLEGDGAPRHRAGEARVFTLEAFAALRDRLDPDGFLAILAHDERLLVRALLTAATVLHADRPDAPVAAGAWIVRTEPDAGLPETPRWLALVARGPVDPALAGRLASLAAGLPVRVLLGPGHPPRPRYAALAAAPGPAAARDALRLELSRRAGEWIELGPVADAGGDFFRVDRDPGPVARWGLAAVALAVLAVALLPLRDRRRPDRPTPGAPIPARLAPALGGGAAAGLAAALVAIHGLTDPLGRGGFLAAGWLGWRWAVRRAPGPAGLAAGTLAGLGLLAALAVDGGATLAPDGPLPPALRPAVLAAVALVLGAVAALPAGAVRAANAGALPALAPWTARALGLALLGAPLLAHWLDGSGAWRGAAAAAGAGLVAATVAALWVRAAEGATARG